jgi:hypothetical protein
LILHDMKSRRLSLQPLELQGFGISGWRTEKEKDEDRQIGNSIKEKIYSSTDW